MNYLYRFVQHPRIYMAASALLVLMTMSGVAWQVSLHLDNERNLPLIQSLGAYTATLDGGTTNSQAMGAAILFGLINQEAKRLVYGKSPADTPAVMASLHVLRTQFIADAVFLVNRQGVIVAHSSQPQVQAVGRNIFFQPFVQRALQGSPGVYPAVGMIDNTPGIYLAAPLRATANRTSDPIGAVVFRIGYDKLNLLLKNWTDGIAILLSPQGVIFASNRDDWLFRPTQKIDRVSDTRQFGSLLDLTHPLPLALNTDETRVEGMRYAVLRQTLDWDDPKGDWKLVLLDLRAPWWTQWQVLGAATLSGLFTSLALFWIFNLVSNASLLRKMYIQLQQSDAVLREREQLLKETQSIAELGTYAFDIYTGQFELSEITYKLLGIDSSYEHSLNGWIALTHPDEQAMLFDYFTNETPGHEKSFDREYRIIRHNDQSTRWMHGLGKLRFDCDGKPIQLVGTIQDITLRKRAEMEIQSLAFYDHLTGLPNRRLLQDRLSHTLAVCKREELSGALLFIDMDNFKSLNDTLGHDIGDLLLQQVASRLTTCVRENDTVARLGGDEFVVMLDDLNLDTLHAAAQAEAIAHKILITLGKAYKLDAHDCHSTPSIGIAQFYGHDKTMEELLKQADIAMYQAKKAGRNTLRFFDPQMQIAITSRITLETELRRALDAQDQLILHYQPQVNAMGQITGAEALVRWQHPRLGMMPSNEFISLAEETGLILPLGQWVLTTACRQLEAWTMSRATAHLTLSVNISAKQFNLQTFTDTVLSSTDRFRIRDGRLKLEITESFLLNNVVEIIAKMKLLQQRGISFSMDDFGTGYSSLQYLKQLPLDQIKIDQSFVRDLASSENDRTIVRTIIAMALSMNLNIIAEGVETQDQRQLLLQLGCASFQGYLYGRPVSIEEFELQLSPA